MTPKIDDALLQAQLHRTLDGTHLALAGRYEGKVRDNYSDGKHRILVATDRLSAFDVVLGTIPWKGQVLNQLSAFWFEQTRAVAPNHLVAVPDPNVTMALECRPLPVEMVVRAYLTGVTDTSIWRRYQAGERRFGDVTLGENLKKNEPLPQVAVTPTTKAERGGHDENVTRDELIRRNAVDAETWARMETLCLALFAVGQAHAQQRGLILVDTKYELGWAPDGSLVFIDEIHTPDSSRYWHADDYEARLSRGEEPRSLDKEYVRRHYASIGYTGHGPPPPIPDDVRIEAARRYIAAYELLTGIDFVPDTQDPIPRIERNLHLA